MGSFKIKDTGYPNTVDNGTQYSGTNIVNSGTAIILKSASINYSTGNNTDNTANPSRFEASEVNVVSSENAKLLLKGVLDLTVAGDMTILKQLRDMSRTKGVKVIYYDSSDHGSVTYNSIISALGVTDSFTSHIASTNHLHVIVNSFSCDQSSTGSLISYNITMEETG